MELQNVELDAECKGFIEDDHEEEDIINSLFKFWLKERASPELLPYPHDIIPNVLELVANQSNMLTTLAIGQPNSGKMKSFVDCLYQMDLERIRYILKSLIRCRLVKIEKFAFGFDDETCQNLGEGEFLYLKRYRKNIEEALKSSILSRLPAQLASLDDPEMQSNPNFSNLANESSHSLSSIPIANQPLLDSHVICRIVGEVGQIIVDPVTRASAVLELGDIFVLQYRVVKDFILNGKIELI